MLKEKSFRPLILLIGDFLALALSIILSIELRNFFRPLGDTDPLYFVLFVVAVIWLVVYYLFGLYDQRQLIFRRQLAQMLTTAQIVNAGLTVIFFYFSPISSEAPKTILFLMLILAQIFTYYWRRFCISAPIFRTSRPWLVVDGDHETTAEIASLIEDKPWKGEADVIYISHNDNDKRLQTHTQALQTIFEKQVGYVVLDMVSVRGQRLFSGLHHLAFNNVQFLDYDDIYEELTGRVRMSSQHPQFFIKQLRQPGYEHTKRFIDVLISLPVVIFSWPVYVVLARRYRKEKQKKTFIGQNQKMIHFEVIPNRFATTYKIFLKIIKGEMTLIGPSLVTEEESASMQQLTEFYYRFLVKPGVFSWRGREIEISAYKHVLNHPQTSARQLSYDLYYTKHRSVLLDLRVFRAWLLRRFVSAQDEFVVKRGNVNKS